MKKTVYDFTETIAELEHSFSPQELADNLRINALRLSMPLDKDKHIKDMQCAVLDACAVLDSIVGKEVEQ